jgi:hypothetical protein
VSKDWRHGISGADMCLIGAAANVFFLAWLIFNRSLCMNTTLIYSVLAEPSLMHFFHLMLVVFFNEGNYQWRRLVVYGLGAYMIL